MPDTVEDILRKKVFTKEDLIVLLACDNNKKNLIFEKAEINQSQTGVLQILQAGIINLSNFCDKDCFYCNKRKSNYRLSRFQLDDKEVLDTIKIANRNDFDFIVLQTGEYQDVKYIHRIEKLISKISGLKRNRLEIILSLGEEPNNILHKWKKYKIKNYLLRMKSTDPSLYAKNHPDNNYHCFNNRINAIKMIRKNGLLTATGILVGLPFQTFENIADDLLFINNLNPSFCEIDTYIRQEDTPAFFLYDIIPPYEERVDLTNRMIAVLKIINKDIKVASREFQTNNKGLYLNFSNSFPDIKITDITPVKQVNSNNDSLINNDRLNLTLNI